MTSVPATPPLVLIVDDSDKNRKLARDVLRAGGLKTIEASDGREALALAAESLPDVILLDLRLPDVDRGLGLISLMRDSAPDVRILVMSWSDSLEDGIAMCGADGFVRKTFRPSELFAAIQAAGVSVPN